MLQSVLTNENCVEKLGLHFFQANCVLRWHNAQDQNEPQIEIVQELQDLDKPSFSSRDEPGQGQDTRHV